MVHENLLKSILNELEPYGAKLIAVGKTKPVSDIRGVYQLGVKDFGENKVQELAAKQEELPTDIRWHMIGHLQRNKVKYIAPFIHLIQAVDSSRLLAEINKQAKKNNRVLDCLLQIHIAREETKFGFSEDELSQLSQDESWGDWGHIRLKGLMGIATFTENQDQIQREFSGLKQLFEHYKANPPHSSWQFSELSMGMTNDYRIALDEGSTMVRIGSAIFGSRN